jgi:hypothetical protein
MFQTSFCIITEMQENAMGTIFVRERRKTEPGEKKPRFRVVGVSDLNLKIYVEHMRKKELEEIAAATGAQLVFLKRGEKEKEATKEGEAVEAAAE